MAKPLYTKHSYLNRNIPYLVSDEIIEYDIQSAGFNLIKFYKLLDERKINYLESLTKHFQKVQIGLYMRQDKEFSKRLSEKFTEARQWFFEQNNLSPDDVLSIKKDAIVTTRRCFETQMNNVVFAEKNVYTSYYLLNRMEFYYNRNQLDVKGIGDDKLKLHRDYMLDFLSEFFKLIEISTPKRATSYLTDFATYYKQRELDPGYYRELNNHSTFRLFDTFFNHQVGVMYMADVNRMDISYNFHRYVVPLITILV